MREVGVKVARLNLPNWDGLSSTLVFTGGERKEHISLQIAVIMELEFC